MNPRSKVEARPDLGRRGRVPLVAFAGLALWYLLLEASAGRELRVGFTIETVRVHEHLSEKDVQAATEILIREAFEDWGEFEPTFATFRTPEQLMGAVMRGEVDFVEFSPLAYLRLPPEQRALLRLDTVVQFADQRLERFVLLAAPGTELEDLRGGAVRLYSGRDRGIGELWLDTLLTSEGGVDTGGFFAEAERASVANEVLLPTFFGKASACLVRESDYRVAVELNPQVARRLVPLRTSPELPFILIGTTTVAPDGLSEFVRTRIVPSVRDGKRAGQALSLLGIVGMSKLEPGDLEALERIVVAADGERGGLTASGGGGEP